jgi:hypothetical protein
MEDSLSVVIGKGMLATEYDSEKNKRESRERSKKSEGEQRRLMQRR